MARKPWISQRKNLFLLVTLLAFLVILPLVFVLSQRGTRLGSRAAPLSCTASHPCIGRVVVETIVPPTQAPRPTRPPGAPTLPPARPTSAPRSIYYLEQDSNLYVLLSVRRERIDFAPYVDPLREVAVIGESAGGVEFNVGASPEFQRRTRGMIAVTSINWAE